MKRRIHMIVKMLLIIVLSSVSYLFVHELGHAIVALCCGATITDFSVVRGNVSSTGGSFQGFTYSLLHSFGVVLPLAISILFLLLPKSKSFFFHFFIVCFGVNSIVFRGALQAWIVVPLLNNSSESDDVVKFMKVTAIHPMIIAVISLCIASLMFYFIFRKEYHIIKQGICKK